VLLELELLSELEQELELDCSFLAFFFVRIFFLFFLFFSLLFEELELESDSELELSLLLFFLGMLPLLPVCDRVEGAVFSATVDELPARGGANSMSKSISSTVGLVVLPATSDLCVGSAS
jgi:hypothetical protein